MNFSGYVPLRRGILDHLMNGDLTNNQYLAYTVLIMLADKSTGMGRINAPVLRYFIPELSKDAAKRTLEGLAQKGYIFREIKERSPLPYPYWVNKYMPTTGKYKLLQLFVGEAIANNDVRYIKYVKGAPEDAPEGAPEDAPEGAHYYKKGEGEVEKGESNNPQVDGQMSEPSCATGRGEQATEQTSPAASGEIPATTKPETTTPYVPPPMKPFRMGAGQKKTPSAAPKTIPAPPPQKAASVIPVDIPEGRLAVIILDQLANPVPHREAAATTWLPLIHEILAEYKDEQELTLAFPWMKTSECWYSDKYDAGPKPMEFITRNIDGIMTAYRKAHRPAPSVIKSTQSTNLASMPDAYQKIFAMEYL
jgi:hypothetical protein